MLEKFTALCCGGNRFEHNRHLIQELSQKLIEETRAAKKTREDSCPHLQGCFGPQPWGDGTSIVWHLFESGIVRGFCTECLKHFNPIPEDVPIDKEFMEWYRRPCGNTMSAGGQPSSLKQFEEFIVDLNTNHELALRKLRYELRPVRTKIKDFLKKLVQYIKKMGQHNEVWL